MKPIYEEEVHATPCLCCNIEALAAFEKRHPELYLRGGYTRMVYYLPYEVRTIKVNP